LMHTDTDATFLSPSDLHLPTQLAVHGTSCSRTVHWTRCLKGRRRCKPRYTPNVDQRMNNGVDSSSAHTQTVLSTVPSTRLGKNRAKLDVLKQTNGRAYSVLRLLKSSVGMLQLKMDKQIQKDTSPS